MARGPDPSGAAVTRENSGPRGRYSGPSRGSGNKKRRSSASKGSDGSHLLERLMALTRSRNAMSQWPAWARQQSAGGLQPLTEFFATRQALPKLRDMRQEFLDQFGVDLPAPPMVAAPSLESFVKPYDDATALANRVYGESVPVINTIYNDLDQALKSRQSEGKKDSAEARAVAAAEQQAMMEQAAALTQPTTLDQALGVAGPGSEAAQQAEADRAFLALRGADQAQLMRNLDAADAEAAEARLSDADAARSGSLGAARTNLDQILTQLGFGRAQAEQQHAQVASAASQENADRQYQYAQLKQQMQKEQMELAQEAERMWADENERIAQSAVSSGRLQWEQQIGARMERNPAATDAMLTILKEAGEGPQGRAVALQILRDEAPILTNRSENPYGKKLNVDVIREWIEEYYDDSEYIDPGRYAQAGGDPLYLPVRDKYMRGSRRG